MSSKKRFKAPKLAAGEKILKITPDRDDNKQYINWFPGHMNKALKQIKSRLKSVDLVLEIRDARVPLTSSNFALDEVLGTKQKLVVFNKTNLADPAKTTLWKNHFRKEGLDFIFINALDKSSINSIILKAKDSIQKNYLKENPDGTPKEKKTIMIVGLPNTGKSTLINRMAKRDATRTADRPGQTQVQQWIKIEPGFELLDTPGVMPPKIDNEEKGIWLGAVHAIPSKIVSNETIACYLIKYFLEAQNEEFKKTYQLESFNIDYLAALDIIGNIRKCLLKAGAIDYERVYKIVVQDYRNTKFGAITFETPV